MPRPLGGLIVALSVHLSDRLPRQCWHVSGLVTDSSLSQCRPLSKAHMDRNKGLRTRPDAYTHSIDQRATTTTVWFRGEKKKRAASACAGSNFSNVGICKGLCLIPGAKWNVSSLLFNQHSCHFHTSRSHCANSKHSSQPRPLRRCGASGRWSEGGKGVQPKLSALTLSN